MLRFFTHFLCSVVFIIGLTTAGKADTLHSRAHAKDIHTKAFARSESVQGLFSLTRRDLPRDIYIIVSELLYDYTFSVEGSVLSGTHVSVHFGQNGNQKPVRFDMVREVPFESGHVSFMATIFEDDIPDPKAGSETPGRGSIDRVYKVGTTSFNNVQITDWLSSTSKNIPGLISESAELAPRSPISVTYALILHLLEGVVSQDIKIPDVVLDALRASVEWEDIKSQDPRSGTPKSPFEVMDRSHDTPSFRIATINPLTVDWNGMTSSGTMRLYAPRGPRYFYEESHLAEWARTRQIPVIVDTAFNQGFFTRPLQPSREQSSFDSLGMKHTIKSIYPVFSTPELQSRFPGEDICKGAPTGKSKRSLLLARAACLSKVQTKYPKLATVPHDAPAEKITVRIKGVVQVLQAFDKVGISASVAGLAAGPGFVIYDLSKGNFIGAGINSVGLAAEIGTLIATRSLMVAGTVGLVAAPFLFLLPFLFDNKHPAGRSNNLTEIVAFKFFGDRGSRGNENCLKERKTKGLSDDCTVLFGPGKIAQTLGWSYYDAVVFVIAFNEGYHMSIEDIGAAFKVKSESPASNSTTANSIATIECDPSVLASDTSRPTIQAPEAGYECKNAKFKLKRNLIQLPVLNKTAEEILPRIVTASGGDCKLLVDPLDGSLIPTYNYTWIGLPAAISCNITTPTADQIGVANGSSIVSTNTSLSTGQFFSSGNFSSNCTNPLTDDSSAYGEIDAVLSHAFSNSSSSAATANYSYTGQSSQDFSIPDISSIPLRNETFDVGNNTNSTSYIGCFDPRIFEFFSAPSYATRLPAAFYSGNSSILSNYTSYISPGNASTDGSFGRGYVPVPPATPFQNLNTSNGVCFTYPSSNFCFPNGTFSGVFNNPGWQLRNVVSMTGPPGFKVSFNARHNNDPSGTNQFERDISSDVFTSNMTIKGDFDGFGPARNEVILDPEQGSLDIYIPDKTQVPSVCLYSDENFRGNIRCLGIGGGDLPNDFKNVTSSMTTHGGALTYLFANRYGDASETKVSGPIKELKGLLYSVNSSLNDLIVALWVLAAPK